MRVWLIALAIGLVGCASTPDLPPSVSALRAGQKAINRGVESGAEEVADLGVYTVQARYNPARCNCPDFEFQLRGAWVRAWAAGAEPTLRRLQSLARKNAPGIQYLSVRGRLTNTMRRSDDKVEFPVFETVE